MNSVRNLFPIASIVLRHNFLSHSQFAMLSNPELNRVLCEKFDVPIAGVVINKVLPDKYEQTKHYMSKGKLSLCIEQTNFFHCILLILFLR